ncbi:unnamed protein product [Aspergillus oryzae]|nr:unnamed protein product [Aspergillus oryzae]
MCWDHDIVPARLSEPAQYPAGRPPIPFDKITADDRIEYFARYTSMSLGRIKNLFLEWAMRSENGALSSECQELNRLHSLCVDGNRVKVDDRFTNPPSLSEEVRDSFVLNILHREAEKESRQRIAARGNFEKTDSREVVETVLCQPRSCSEFRMVQLVYEWCRRTKKADLRELLPYFDVAAHTVGQKHWLLQELPAATELPALVMNGLINSDILQPHELRSFHLDYPGIRWKKIFSVENRLANLFEVLEKSLSHFHRKLLVLRLDNRFSIALYIPRLIGIDEEAPVGRCVLAFGFLQTQNQENALERIFLSGVNYKLHFNHTTLQLYNGRRQNTFIWIGQPGINDASFRQVKGKANRARQRHQTIVEGVNHDWVISIALERFSQNTRTQELYVISNADVHSSRTLDLWHRSIDTLETIPMFERTPPPLVIAKASTADLSSQPEDFIELICKGDFSRLNRMSMQSNIIPVVQFCFEHSECSLIAKIYHHFLSSPSVVKAWLAPTELLDALLQGLLYAPENVVFFSRLCPWKDNLPDRLCRSLRPRIPYLLESVFRSVSRVGSLAIGALHAIACEANTLSLTTFRNLVESASLLLRSPEQMLDVCLECLQPTSERLLDECPPAQAYSTRNLFAIAIDHNEEAWGAKRLASGDHVRFELARYPENEFLTERPSFDAIIESARPGTVTFSCLSYPPAYIASARWRLKHCGSFVTSKAMLDSLVTLMEQKTSACALYTMLVNGDWRPVVEKEDATYDPRIDLNDCQNEAVKESLNSCLTCIWGPPGTGKTQTVVAILKELFCRGYEERILVTAPSHNAVDNILKRYLVFADSLEIRPLRVSTNIYRVSPDLVQYTCDGMERKDFNHDPDAKRLALERIQQARLVFTTCAGAGLGLLRKEKFQIVLIDESSQQSEPMSLIPLSKGCHRAILVGDHVQLRGTTGTYAKVMGFEVSLFERLYSSDITTMNRVVSKVMLDLQYRMHPQVSEFPSSEFYDGRLRADASCLDRPLSNTSFPWPPQENVADGSLARCVFVPCLGPEDSGYRSKGNTSQAELCKKVYQLLMISDSVIPSIAVLTPYARQVKILQASLPGSATISSIDGFQGREADIVIFVTVRCNPHGDIGFLSDLRRLNVVLTRARAGLIVIGCPRTLIHEARLDRGDADPDDTAYKMTGEKGVDEAIRQDSKSVWRRLVASLVKVEIA